MNEYRRIFIPGKYYRPWSIYWQLFDLQWCRGATFCRRARALWKGPFAFPVINSMSCIWAECCRTAAYSLWEEGVCTGWVFCFWLWSICAVFVEIIHFRALCHPWWHWTVWWTSTSHSWGEDYRSSCYWPYRWNTLKHWWNFWMHFQSSKQKLLLCNEILAWEGLLNSI